MSEALHRYPRGGSDKLVLLCLCDHANADTGICWPSVDRIAARACVSRASVKRSLRQLELDGVLQTIKARGRGRTNRFRVVLEEIVAMPELTTAIPDELVAAFDAMVAVDNTPDSVDNSVDNLCTDSQKRAHLDTEKGSNLAPNLLKPSCETSLTQDEAIGGESK